ncbi:hypothetical protein Tcan_02841 [Toxocara canis]|uniref:Clc-like protein 2 n=1 Tax=Toxocara canis TaxID=6265 RepID=A0A0B2VAD4_TOXCA|nr:hypothetical protein Tcan_02841 [Toxocara canis]
MSSGNVFGEKASILFAVVLTLTGLGLSIAAILLPSWQVVNLREYNSIHEHGLWLDCTRHSRDSNANVLLRRYATITEPLHCVYKFDYDKYSGTFDLEDDNSPVGEVNRHKFYGWHTATLILLGLALLTAFLSICVGLCACCYGSLALIFTVITLLTRWHTATLILLGLALLTAFLSICVGLCACCYGSLALIFTVITLLTTFLSMIAVGLFFFFSHRADNRFIKGIVGTYEQRVGLAFFLEMAAAILHFIAFLVSLLFAYFSLSKKSNSSDHYSINRSSKTNITNVGRSIEFEPQMIYQQNIASSNIRPPYYSKHQEQYEKNVAESMPELGVRQFSNEVISQRVRRKSETCV